jgi:type I restriction enzyme M protein
MELAARRDSSPMFALASAGPSVLPLHPMESQPLALSQLESHLWKAAWLLKGPVDAADFKNYIFPLLFLKRLSDVHDEEHAAALTA